MALNLSSSLEDYLESMLFIYEKEGRIRTTDVSKRLMVEKSSVNSAIKKLKNLGLVEQERYGDIELTKRGEKEAHRIRNRHLTLLKFLSDFLGVKPKEAEKDACKLEHVLSENTFNRIEKFVSYIEESPSFDKEKWKESFECYLTSGDCGAGKNAY